MILPVTGVNHVQEDPPLCLSMSFEIVREARMVPNRFVFKTEVIVSWSVRWRSEECVIPNQRRIERTYQQHSQGYLFSQSTINTEFRRNTFSVSNLLHVSTEATSPENRECAPEGNFVSCSSRVSVFLPTRIHDTPFRAREWVIPRPMPREAPVMSAVLPTRRGEFMWWSPKWSKLKEL